MAAKERKKSSGSRAPRGAKTPRRGPARRAVGKPAPAEEALTDETLAEESEDELEPPPEEIEAAADETAAAVEIEIEAELEDEETPASALEGAFARSEPQPAGRALVRHDPLSAYMHEVRRYPLLSREDEHALAVRYRETGDLEAARRLVTANLRLVVKIAHQYRSAYRNLVDLVQEGNLGLMQAVKKYDPWRGVKLSAYASWWIRAYILKFIVNNWRLVKIGTTQAQRKLFFNLRREKENLEKLGRPAETGELAARLEVTEQEVEEMERRLGAADLSLDTPVRRDEAEGETHLDRVAATRAAEPAETAESIEFRRRLEEKLDAFGVTLRGREKTLFEERIRGESPKTLQEIGERWGISRERARQLEKRLKDRLRDYLRRELGDAVEVALGHGG